MCVVVSRDAEGPLGTKTTALPVPAGALDVQHYYFHDILVRVLCSILSHVCRL